MILTRRRMMEAGGGILAAFVVGPAPAQPAMSSRSPCGARPTARMSGSTRSAFISSPARRCAGPTAIRGNSHTVTSYHPEMFERPLRIPAGAKPWNSDYLLPDESFSMTFTEDGVYDYYCVPHEHAGMVGRIVVGTPAAGRGGGRNAGDRADAAAGGGAERLSVGRGDRREGRRPSQLRRGPEGERRHAVGGLATPGRARRAER